MGTDAPTVAMTREDAQCGLADEWRGRRISVCPPGFFSDRQAWKCNLPDSLSGDEVPRIADTLLDGVVFLYPTPEDAENHARLGGTAFFIGKPIVINGEVTGAYCPYLVSNRHVVWSGGSPIARVNRVDGGKPDVIDLDQHQWIVHPDGDDLAVASVFRKVMIGIHRHSHIPTQQLLTRAMAQDYEVGIGDEVLMIGRFINHQGRLHNQPAVRFGSISVMDRPISNSAIGQDQLSYSVEMRSRTGFSGSPVAVYRTPNTVYERAQ